MITIITNFPCSNTRIFFSFKIRPYITMNLTFDTSSYQSRVELKLKYSN